jgi:hypothetical protein
MLLREILNVRYNNNVIIIKNKLKLSLSLLNGRCSSNDILKNRISTLSSLALIDANCNNRNYNNRLRTLSSSSTLSLLPLQSSLSIRYNSTISSIKANTNTNTNGIKKLKSRSNKTTKKPSPSSSSSSKDDKNYEANKIPLILSKPSLLSSSSAITIDNIDDFITFSMAHLRQSEIDELLELMNNITNGNRQNLLNGKQYNRTNTMMELNTYRMMINRIVDTTKGAPLLPLIIDTSLMKKTQQNLQEVLIACYNKKFNTNNNNNDINTIDTNDTNDNVFNKMNEAIDISNKIVSVLPLIDSKELINEFVDYSKGNISLSLLIRSLYVKTKTNNNAFYIMKLLSQFLEIPYGADSKIVRSTYDRIHKREVYA